MNQPQPVKRDIVRSPTGMRAAFQAAMSRVMPRALLAAHYGDTDPNLPTIDMVSAALAGNAGIRRDPAWTASRREARR